MKKKNNVIHFKSDQEETIPVPVLKNFRVANDEVIAEVERVIEVPLSELDRDDDL